MKKIILICAVLIIAIACEKNEKDTDTFGTVVLSIDKTDEIVIQTKSTTLPAEDTYGVIIKNTASNDTISEGSYAEFKEPLVLVTGNYNIQAESATPEAAIIDRGTARYYGATDFRVNAGLNTDVALQCTMVNARVSIGYSSIFELVFKDYSVSINEDSFAERKVIFDNTATITDEATWAYFNIDPTPSLTLVITATRRDDGAIKTYTRTLEGIAAKTWNRITISSTVVQGELRTGIKVDTEKIDIDQEVNIDPY